MSTLPSNKHDNNGQNGQYSNLNLNQNHRSHELIYRSKSLPSKKQDSLVIDNSDAKRTNANPWNKKSCYESVKCEEKMKLKEEKNSGKNKSTLSLHITAYENTIVPDAELLCGVKSCADNKNVIEASDLGMNGQEFPRQKKNQVPQKPEVAQHRNGQELINPNQRVIRHQQQLPVAALPLPQKTLPPTTTSKDYLQIFLVSLNRMTYDALIEQYKKVCAEQQPISLIQKVNSIYGSKMRYNDIHCVQKTRYILRGRHIESDFIHCNWLSGSKEKLLACQGPMASTTEDFLKMIYDENIRVIIMLCKSIEMGIEKSQDYFTGTKSYGNFTVSSRESQSITIFDKAVPETFKILQFQLSCSLFPGVVKTVKHLQYISWPDMGIPADAEVITRIIRFAKENAGEQPVVLHCAAGAGRTGCVALAWVLYDSCLNGRVSSVEEAFRQLRIERYGVIQKPQQYFFTILCVLELLLTRPNDELLRINKNQLSALRDKYLHFCRRENSQN